MTEVSYPFETSVCREDDGDMCLDLVLDRNNLVSISIGSDGCLNWAGQLDGVSQHEHVPPSPLGLLLFKLIDMGASHD